MRICVFGSYDADVHPRVRILADGLRARGHEIVECNARLGVDTAGRIAAVSSPRGALTLLVRLLRSWAALLARSRGVGRVDAVLVGYLGVFDVLLARLRWPRTTVVLDHLAPVSGTGVDRALGGGARQRALGAVDATAERVADLVVVDTPEHARALPPSRRDRAVVVPVGAPERWFRTPAPRSVPPLRIVFFGLYTPLQGTPVIASALSALADQGVAFEATMIGGGQQLEEARARLRTAREVTWRSWTAPDELPDVVAAHDVCLGIFGTTPKARRVVPNKVFQGAAAGCAVVTSDTPPQRELLGSAARLVPAGDAPALTAALRELAEDGEAVLAARRAAHDWASRRCRPAAVVEPLDAWLRSPAGPRATQPR